MSQIPAQLEGYRTIQDTSLPVAIKLLVGACLQLLPHMYDSCFNTGILSAYWKTAHLVLINKGKKIETLCHLIGPIYAGYGEERDKRNCINPCAGGHCMASAVWFQEGSLHSGCHVNLGEVVQAIRRVKERNHYSREIVLLVTLNIKNAFNLALNGGICWKHWRFLRYQNISYIDKGTSCRNAYC